MSLWETAAWQRTANYPGKPLANQFSLVQMAFLAASKANTWRLCQRQSKLAQLGRPKIARTESRLHVCQACFFAVQR